MLKVKVSKFTFITFSAFFYFYIVFAQTFGSVLIAYVLRGSCDVTVADCTFWVVPGSSTTNVTSTSFYIFFAAKLSLKLLEANHS